MTILGKIASAIEPRLDPFVESVFHPLLRQDPLVIYDVGAAGEIFLPPGITTCEMSRVYGFEPVPESFRRLRAREKPLRCARPEDLLWDRTSVDLPHNLGVTIIYGHTPAFDLQVRWNEPFSIGIDTGAVYGGKLTALRLPDATVFQV